MIRFVAAIRFAKTANVAIYSVIVDFANGSIWATVAELAHG